MSDGIKLCKDCKYFGNLDFVAVTCGSAVDCQHPKNIKIDFVEGGYSPRMFARDFRELECGVGAKFFEPKGVV